MFVVLRLLVLLVPIASDIETAWEGVREAEQPVIHVFLATSDIHLQYKLRLSRRRGTSACANNGRLCTQSLSDHRVFRLRMPRAADWDYLCRIFEAAVKAGVTTINVPDTVGYTFPHEYEALFRYLQ